MSHSIVSFDLLSSQCKDGSPYRRAFTDIPVMLQSGIAIRDHSSWLCPSSFLVMCTESEDVWNCWGYLSHMVTRDVAMC